ncbi:PREDICTED: dnaJ homolog subfamily C member 27-like isoform X2 [Priapulus caudatus]|uniref:DnaJ homolog subfamily C member 27-like isoform X2 n=1 Tax=Priapulus caudatus TaxID=37621 RepID=A0ABM1ES16_PRICU|nr:PREDICTED: dnaJ homolog subfamily C member 27-like isoform X2 [Priapulus caudatus]
MDSDKSASQPLRVKVISMGNPKVGKVRNEFYNETNGILLVYDVTDRNSFGALQEWLDEMKNEMGNPSDMSNGVFIVCANKIDKKREVEELEGRLWAETKGFLYFETSAQSGQGITDMFETLFREMVNVLENGPQPLVTPENTSGLSMGYTKEQIEAIHRLKYCKNSFEKLGLKVGATRDEVNKAYRRLAVLLHPDKSIAPGSEDAFKILVKVRSTLLNIAF